MAEFSRFSELPKELQLQTWEAAIPQSPSVHFLSYPQKRGRSHTRCTYQWQRELANANRTINVHKAPVTGEPSMRARTWGRYSSYFASLALLHACHESRRVCLSHTASCKAHDSDGHGKDSSNIVSTDSYTLNLATDIICIQDPIRASLGTSHDTSPCHQDWIPPSEFMGNWITELSGGINGDFDCATSLGDGSLETRLKVIYLLDYDIKPKHTIVAGTTEPTHDGIKPSNESEIESDDHSAVKLPGHTSTHNGKFHGHGVNFYALSANIKETCIGWNVPQESRDFYSDVLCHLQHRYGFGVVRRLEEAEKGDYRIYIEFLACVEA